MKLPPRARRLGRLVLSPDLRANAMHEWVRRGSGEPPLPAGPICNVVMVCHGNICRSPFAEGLLALRRGDLTVRSAGLVASADSPAESAALRVASRRGVDLTQHRSQPLLADDIDWADLILTMEAHQSVEIRRRWRRSRSKTRLLGDYLETPPHSIADPWGGSDALFEEKFGLIETAITRMLARL